MVWKNPQSLTSQGCKRLGACLIVAPEVEREHSGRFRKSHVKSREEDSSQSQEGAPNLGHRPLNKGKIPPDSYTRERIYQPKGP